MLNRFACAGESVAAGTILEPIEHSLKIKVQHDQATLRHHSEELSARVRSKSSASTPRCRHLAKLHKFSPLHRETVMTIQFSKQRIAVLLMASPERGQASFADSFVPGTIPARSASARGLSTSMTLNYGRASA